MSLDDVKLPSHRTCPNCLLPAVMTNFRPDPGFDPGMREYHCPSCGYEWYHVPKKHIAIENIQLTFATKEKP